MADKVESGKAGRGKKDSFPGRRDHSTKFKRQKTDICPFNEPQRVHGARV